VNQDGRQKLTLKEVILRIVAFILLLGIPFTLNVMFYGWEGALLRWEGNDILILTGVMVLCTGVIFIFFVFVFGLISLWEKGKK
jgi:hypothetical protein